MAGGSVSSHTLDDVSDAEPGLMTTVPRKHFEYVRRKK